MARCVVRRQGNISIILIGLVSVMVLFAFSLSDRLRGHTQLLTVGDYTQIARYFLESRAGDVMRQLQMQANEVDNEVFKAFRAGPGTHTIPPSVYRPTPLLEKLKNDFQIEPVGQPTITLELGRALPFPPGVHPPATKPGIESRGLLTIVCKARFRGRTYSLTVNYPYLVVLRLTPILKEFVFFADRLDLEQRRVFGTDDKLNILFTAKGEHPLDITDSAFNQYIRQRPWIFWPPMSGLSGDVNRCGRVYLGPDDKPIYLNLAGELEGQVAMSDMFQVWPEFFKVVQGRQLFQYQPLFPQAGASSLRLRGMTLNLQMRGHNAIMGVMGFCHELYDRTNGMFSTSARKLSDFLEKDPAYQELRTREENLALASGFKFLGLNAELDWDSATKGPYRGPSRQVFGKVLGRFFLLTFFDYISAQGGGAVLEYDPNPTDRRYPTYNNYSTVSFLPADPSQTYSDYMSRVVSGGVDYQGGAVPSHYMPYNPVPQVDSSGRPTKKLLDYRDFQPADQFRLSEPFSVFSRNWFALDRRKRLDDPGLNSIQARISRVFKNQEDFKKGVGLDKGRCWIDGVVLVGGDLDLADLTIPSDQIRGGVVLVGGSITLGNITRGFDFNRSPEAFLGPLNTVLEALPQHEFLTFVSVAGRPITLKCAKYLGVQLVSMNPNAANVTDQILFEGREDLVFCGGIAVNTPNLERRLKEFGRIGTRDPIFLYVPPMADPDPSQAASILHHMRGYGLYLVTGEAAQ
jgi:hypothetical protein